MKNTLLVFSIISLFGILKAEETKKRNLNDYSGRYTFVYNSSTIDNVLVEFRNDSILSVQTNVGTANLIFVKGDEFKISEYDGRVIFQRDSTNQKVIGVKVIVPVSNIDIEGKKEQ
jgi:Zn/Cd-binding protein ZinT